MLIAAPQSPPRQPPSPPPCRSASVEAFRHWGGPDTAGLIALLAILVLLALTPSKALAHGDDHPADLRNARNQFTHLRPLRTAPSVPILAQDGSRLDLGRFRGRLILVNLWATWCPPCLYELPALDRLQALLGSDAFAVVALSIDEGDISGLVSFVNRLGLRNLAIYQDITRRAQDTLPLYGLPITYLIDSDGLVLGYIVGATEWDSPEALEFLRHYIRVSPAASSSRQGSGGLSGKAAVQGATRTLQGTGGS